MHQDLPLRWDLLQRYRLIEIIALWEGRLTTQHLRRAFGIGRQQASRDINEYNRHIGPDNLVYDKHLRGYKPAPFFKPALTSGVADEYLHLLNRQRDLELRFESLPLKAPNTEVLYIPPRQLSPGLVQAIVAAARQNQRLEIEYVSMENPDQEVRVIAPHTLVFSGVRWHVRAYCEKNRGFRDFVLSRFRGLPDLIGDSPNPVEQDQLWHTPATVSLKPDPRLSNAQRAIVEHDYGMIDGELSLKTRGPLIPYIIPLLQIDPCVLQGKASAQQIIVDNLDEIRPWLF